MGGSVDSKPIVDDDNNNNNNDGTDSNADHPIGTANITNTHTNGNGNDNDKATTETDEAETLGGLPQDSSGVAVEVAAAIRAPEVPTTGSSTPLESSAAMGASEPVPVPGTTAGITSTGNGNDDSNSDWSTLPQNQQEQQQQHHHRPLLPPRPLMQGPLRSPPPLPSAATAGISSSVGNLATPAVSTTTIALATAATYPLLGGGSGGWGISQTQTQGTPNHPVEASVVAAQPKSKPQSLSLPMSLLPAAVTRGDTVKSGKKLGRPRKGRPDNDRTDTTTHIGKKFKGHQGKASSKFKKSGGTNTTTTTTAKATQPRKNKRRASDTVSTLAQSKRQRISERGVVRTLAVVDAAPDRLTNPLMEIPGQTVIRNNGGFPTVSSSAPTAAVNAASTAGLTPLYVHSSQSNPLRAADSLALLDLTYPVHVDTFSLAYTARCLGFDVPHTTLPTNDDESTTVAEQQQRQQQQTQSQSQQHEKQQQQQLDKVSLNPSDHPILQDDSYRQIPRLGTFCQNVWLRERENNNSMSSAYRSTSASAITDDDEKSIVTQNATATSRTSSEPPVLMDPIYASLLQQPPVHPTPVTTGQQARLLLRAGSSTTAKALQPVLDAARQYLTPLLPVLPNDDNSTKNTDSGGDSRCAPQDSNDWSWISIQEFAHKHPETNRLWSPKTQAATGLFLLQGGLPVGLVAYQFQWVPVAVSQEHQQPSSNVQQARQSQTEPLPRESTAFEPIATTSSELILCLKDLRNVSHSFLHKDHPHRDEQLQHSKESPTLTEREECILMLLMALCLEHARICHVWYAVLQVTPQLVPFLERYFCMTVVPTPTEAAPAVSNDVFSSSSSNNESHNQSTSSPEVHMVCDMRKCSYRYAFLLYRQDKSNNGPARSLVRNQAVTAALPRPQRWLVRLPNLEDTVAALQAPDAAMLAQARPKRAVARKTSPYFCGATGQQLQGVVRLRAKIPSTNEPMQIVRLDPQGVEGAPLQIPTFYTEPSLDILRNFALPAKATPEENKEEEDELVRELVARQRELEVLETGIEPTLRMLLGKAVDERGEYESAEAGLRREEEKRILLDDRKMFERRKEMDVAWQKQLEQDMDAVCDICKDGEVTPDNQILFCESCNVAVHQMCYGIEHVPEGDYYCMACRHLGRNRSAVSRDPEAPKQAAAPLPICCELCPLKQGAFIRTDVQPKNGEETAFGKWVHVICAKWQGLNFVDNNKPDLIEDVAELKMNFRRYDVKCQLCMGDRGAMNQCRFDGCPAWSHVTCARASGTCDVVHGENSGGPVETDPWSLMCPEHSNIKPADVPEDAIKIETLIAAAKEFPPEPMPPPPPLVRKPFNIATRKEREALLADHDYEQELLEELGTKKLQGVRCEVCDQCEENGKFLNRCVMCYVVVCDACTLEADKAGGNFKCSGCSYVDAKRKEGEEVDPPNCASCFQKGGLLRRGSASPISKKSFWSQNPKEYKKSLFGRKLWIHSICAFWNTGAIVSVDTGEVDLSDVIMSHGRGFVIPNVKCFLCGNSGGLKIKCDHEGCRVADGDKMLPTSFHATCARQAGLEVNSKEIGQKTHFYVKCYRHGGNEFNLRARLEDLLEIEKKRCGKRFARSDTPMKFSEASRLLNASILVMRILGCAWRWSEWWVDYNSTWEPLLEPDQREEDMTSEQLRIVKSTRESRCDDARKCRLAPLGAALRSRKYDTQDGFDRNALSRALRAVLHTKSLVGPLDDLEIDFFVDWLGRAYRSESRLLGLGEDSILVGRKNWCLHIQDQSPKFELGLRSVPGMQEPNADQAFEIDTNDVDDFLQTEVLTDEIRTTSRRQRNSKHVSRASAKSGGRDRDRNRKRSRVRADSDHQSIISTSVAAVVPSALKKRAGRPPKERNAIIPQRSPPAVASSGRKRAGRSPKIRSDAGSSVRESNEQGTDEANAEMKPRKKGPGRPPKIRPPSMDSESVTEASVEEAAETSLEQERVESDAEPQRPVRVRRRDRRPSPERVAEIDLPATVVPTTGSSKKRAGRPPKIHHSALDPVPSVGSSAQDATEFVQDDARSESSRGRSHRSRRSIESYDPASLPARKVRSAESIPPKKRRGRPPKVRPDLGSTPPTAEAEPSADHLVKKTPLPKRDTNGKFKVSRPKKSDGRSSQTHTLDAAVKSQKGSVRESLKHSAATETAADPAMAAPLIRPKRKRGRPKRHREEETSEAGKHDPAVDGAVAELADDPPIDSAVTETADMSDIDPSPSSPPRKRGPGRPKKRRKIRREQEVTSGAGAVDPAISKFDVVKRRGHSTTRYPEKSADKVKSKSYTTDSSGATDTDDATDESPERRTRVLSEDNLTIANLVARKRGSSRDSNRKRDRKLAPTTAIAAAATIGEQDSKPAASMLADTDTSKSTSTSRLEERDQTSPERNDKGSPAPSEDASTETESSNTGPLLSKQDKGTPVKDSTPLPADGEADADTDADTPSKRGRRRGKKEAARLMS